MVEDGITPDMVRLAEGEMSPEQKVASDARYDVVKHMRPDDYQDPDKAGIIEQVCSWAEKNAIAEYQRIKDTDPLIAIYNKLQPMRGLWKDNDYLFSGNMTLIEAARERWAESWRHMIRFSRNTDTESALNPQELAENLAESGGNKFMLLEEFVSGEVDDQKTTAFLRGMDALPPEVTDLKAYLQTQPDSNIDDYNRKVYQGLAPRVSVMRNNVGDPSFVHGLPTSIPGVQVEIENIGKSYQHIWLVIGTEPLTQVIESIDAVTVR